MKVLVVGSGGREHTLCWALKRSAIIEKLFAAPGNGGMAELATCIDIAASDLDGILAFCQREAIDFVVVGPEDPLVLGLVDRLDGAGEREQHDPVTKKLANEFIAEMGELSNVFTKYLGEWSSPTAMKADSAQFIKVTGELFKAVQKRIDRENTQLYPKLEAVS